MRRRAPSSLQPMFGRGSGALRDHLYSEAEVAAALESYIASNSLQVCRCIDPAEVTPMLFDRNGKESLASRVRVMVCSQPRLRFLVATLVDCSMRLH